MTTAEPERPRRSRWRDTPWPTVAALVLAVLPVLVLIPYHLLTLHTGYVASDDRAVTYMSVRNIGHHQVLLGPYSREGWDHPGPTLYYLLWPAYLILGHADASLPITALIVNGISIVGVALLVRRRLGFGTMLWTLVVLGVYLRFMEAGFLRDVWNPMIPVLPFALMVLLCWTAVLGDVWALPVALGIGWFCVQSHVGYAAGVVAALAVTAVGIAVRWWRTGQRNPFGGRVGRRVLKVLGVSVVVTAVLWALPLYQQFTHQPGNLGTIVTYFRTSKPTTSWHTAVHELLTQLGKPVAYVTGRNQYQERSHQLPPILPVWTGAVAVVLATAAIVLAWLRRQTAVLWLAAYGVVMTFTGVYAVKRVVGPVYDYLVLWTVVAAVIMWVVMGAALFAPRPVRVVDPAPEAAAGPADGTASATTPAPAEPAAPVEEEPPRVAVAERVARVSRPVRLVAAGVAFALLAVLTALNTDTTARHAPGDTPAMRPLADAVVTWLGPANRHAAVSVKYWTANGTNLETVFAGSGLILQLQEKGVHAQGSPYFALALGKSNTARYDECKPLTVAFAYTAAGTPKHFYLLATAGDLRVFVPDGTPLCNRLGLPA